MKESNIMENKVDIYNDVIIEALVNPLQLISNKNTGGSIRISINTWNSTLHLERTIYFTEEDIKKFIKQHLQNA